MYPPSAEESHCTIMIHMPVMTVKPVADAPVFDQGETVRRPNPDPSDRSTKDSPIAAKAPAKMGPHVTADRMPSVDVRLAVSIELAVVDGACIDILLWVHSSVPNQCK
jgi:hypothetical protein